MKTKQTKIRVKRLTTEDFIEKAFNKLFQSVGLEKWDKEFTKQDNWYTLKTWTKAESEKFKQWFIQEIKKDLKYTSRAAEKEWAWFDLMWGWKEANS